MIEKEIEKNYAFVTLDDSAESMVVAIADTTNHIGYKVEHIKVVGEIDTSSITMGHQIIMGQLIFLQ